jgi:hypothetical protein
VRNKADGRDGQKFRDEMILKQRNIIWSDAIGNGRLVDRFLWKGSPNPPLVQRIVAWFFGLFFIAAGLGFLAIVLAGHSKDFWIAWPFSIASLLIGIRVFRNGFKVRNSG